VCISLGFSSDVFAQDPIFSQFYGNPLYLNPAMTGATVCPRITLNYRNQWPGLDGTTYATYSASYDQHFEVLTGAVGLIAYHDVAGPGQLTTDQVSGIYNYALEVNKHLNFRFALQGAYFQKKIDWTQLTFGDQIDSRKGFVYDTKEVQEFKGNSGWDFSAGFFGFTRGLRSKRTYYGGGAVHHLNEPDQGLINISTMPMKITVHAGARFPVGNSRDNVSVSPNILFQKQANYEQLNLGLYLQKAGFVSGLWFRNKDAFILLVGFVKDQIRVGYSYDVTVSKLTNKTAGAHELSMAITMPCPKKKEGYKGAGYDHLRGGL
jgi:type IX secretion system PorP/SprF family membrane protein